MRRIKEWMEGKLYDYALWFVCKRNSDYRDLREWLKDYENIGFLVTRTFSGRKLEFKWVSAPERGRESDLIENICSNNVLLERMNMVAGATRIQGGKTIGDSIE